MLTTIIHLLRLNLSHKLVNQDQLLRKVLIIIEQTWNLEIFPKVKR